MRRPAQETALVLSIAGAAVQVHFLTALFNLAPHTSGRTTYVKKFCRLAAFQTLIFATLTGTFILT